MTNFHATGVFANYSNNCGELMNDYDLALYEAMIVARIPDYIAWCGDELFVASECKLTNSDVAREWLDITADAWEEYCEATADDDAYFTAADDYDLELPVGYNPGWDDGTHDDRCIYGDDCNSDEDDELTIGDIIDSYI